MMPAMAIPGMTEMNEQRDVFEDPANQQAYLGVPQALRRQGPLENDLVRSPVVQVQEVHPEEGGPRQSRMVPGEMQVHKVSRPAEELRPAAELMHRDSDRDEPPTEEQDELGCVGPHHGTQTAKISIDGREGPQNDDQDGESHRLAVADPRHHLGEDAIEREGRPEQRRAKVEQRVEHDHQKCVRQRDPWPEAVLEKLADRDDFESEIEGNEKEGGNHNAEDGVEFEVPLRQSADIGRARHGEEVAGFDICRDRRHSDGRPPQRTRAEEILLGTNACLGARTQADDENDGEVRDDNPKVDHGWRLAVAVNRDFRFACQRWTCASRIPN